MRIRNPGFKIRPNLVIPFYSDICKSETITGLEPIGMMISAHDGAETYSDIFAEGLLNGIGSIISTSQNNEANVSIYAGCEEDILNISAGGMADIAVTTSISCNGDCVLVLHNDEATLSYWIDVGNIIDDMQISANDAVNVMNDISLDISGDTSHIIESGGTTIPDKVGYVDRFTVGAEDDWLIGRMYKEKTVDLIILSDQ